ncbi:MAG: hypothetical protein KatS3mg076_1586 [Candidatus Binatia bacterium]|nr:MAG: hypothetical protein KatS3mg076_1586 [Candidatus Binatia bacterium]
MADFLTGLRALLAPAYAWAFLRALEDARWGWTALGLYGLACLTDVLDGPLARRRGQVRPRGAFFDAGADILFVTCALGAAWYAGIAPWWVPGSVLGAFVFFVLHSRWLATPDTPRLVPSRLGHWGGVANYVLVGVLAVEEACGLHLLGSRVLGWVFAVVPLYSTVGALARLPLGPR